MKDYVSQYQRLFNEHEFKKQMKIESIVWAIIFIVGVYVCFIEITNIPLGV